MPNATLLPVHELPRDAKAVEAVVHRLRLDPRRLLQEGNLEQSVRQILLDVADRGDAALVDAARRFDDADFQPEQILVEPREMASAAQRVEPELLAAVRLAIAQVREYQSHILPEPPVELERGDLRMGLRYTPLDSAGCYFPGGKASYPSSLIHLAVPAQVAGVGEVVAVTPPSRFGKTDLVLATAHELGLPFLIRAGGAAAVGALAFGTQRVPRVDKIVGPGNRYVQVAKRLLAGAVGVDGFLGPSEVLVFADDDADPRTVAADLLAQAEHDPGSCFLLTTSDEVAHRTLDQIERQLPSLSRRDAIERALREESCIVVGDESSLVALAAELAPEHLSVRTGDPRRTLESLPHAGCAFLGEWSPVAAGDYVAGPSHCLPTNTTARFGGGISVFEFLKRGGVVQYGPESIAADTPAAAILADAEGLDAHAASIRARVS
jgi:histidinol dehydrogenase